MSSTITIPDSVNWTKGSYLAYLAPWGAGSLKQGVDYWNTLTLTPELFPNSVSMSWKWPETPAPMGVYNYNMVVYGNANHSIVPNPIPALQVKDIGTLTQTHGITLGGDTSKYDVMTDFWLTKTGGDLDSKLFEVEIFEHTPAYSKWYVDHATQLGTYTDAQGRAWTMAIDKSARLAPDILIMPKGGGALLNGSVDIKGMFDWLTANNVITGNEYFNGLAIGAEVRQGSGSFTLDTFNIDYAAAPVGAKTPVAVTLDKAAAITTPVLDASAHDVFRFYDPRTGDHFYTTSAAEKAAIQASLPNYQYEGAAWATPDKAAGTTDVFRFYDAATDSHFYTTNATERDVIVKTLPSYHYEGVAFQAYADTGAAGSFALERFYNTATGQHHFATLGEAEGIRQGAAGAHWVDEGRGFVVHAATGDALA